MSETPRKLTAHEFVAASCTQQSIMAADVDEETKRRLQRDHTIGCREHWNYCVHESGHAVEVIRMGQQLRRVVVFEKGTRRLDQSNGETRWRGDDRLSLHQRIRISAAGHAAERLWGVNHVDNVNALLGGAGGDLAIVARICCLMRRPSGEGRVCARDRKAARQHWQKHYKALRRNMLKDSSYERQVKAVAKELSLRGRLTGPEVEVIMFSFRPPIYERQSISESSVLNVEDQKVQSSA